MLLHRAGGILPSLSLDLASSGAFPAGVTFTRASTATFVGSNGLIQSAASGQARFGYDPVTLGALGYLSEEARTNIITQSQLASGWTVSATTMTRNNLTAPDGTTTAALITEDTSTAAHYVFGNGGTTVPGGNAASVFVKAGTIRYISVRGDPSTDASHFPWVTLDTQTGTIVGNADVTTKAAIAYPNGWYRVLFTWTNAPIAGTSNIVIAGSDVSTAPSAATVTGNSYLGTSKTYYVWGAQIELTSTNYPGPTSYIPTTGATVTRATDVATEPTTGWLAAAQGTIVSQFRTPPVLGTLPVLSIDDGTANNNLVVQTVAADPKFLVTTGGVTQANIDAGTVAAATSYKMATSYVVNDFEASILGGAAVVDNSGTIPTVTTLRIGRDQAGNYLNEHIASIKYYQAALPVAAYSI